MELRKDPITQTWVVLGHREETPEAATGCSLCPRPGDAQPSLLAIPSEGPWQVRAVPHLDPLYRIENEMGRQAEGIYDKMQTVGAHEIIIETPDHDRHLSQLSEDRKSTRLNSSHIQKSRMPSSA